MKTRIKLLMMSLIAVWILMQMGVPAVLAKEETGEKPKKLLSLELKDVDIQDALQLIAQECKINIAAGPDIRGKVSVRFSGVTMEEALTTVLRINGYDYVKEGAILRVIKLDPSRQWGQQKEVKIIDELFTLKHVDATAIKNCIQGMLTPNGRIQAFVRSIGVGSEKTEGRSNVLVISDTSENIEKIRQIIDKLDIPLPQIMIEAKILEVGVDKNFELGIDWNISASVSGAKIPSAFPFSADEKISQFPVPQLQAEDAPANSSFPYASGTDFSFGTISFSQFSAMLKALETKGDVNILSNPKIATLDNQEARIVIGDIVPIPTYTYNAETGSWGITGYEEEEVGITLSVTPHVCEDNTIIMKVNPEISSITGYVIGPSGEKEKPILSTRKTATQVRVKDRETIVIGGLMRDKTTININKVPILGDVPILGWFFKKKINSTEKIDLMIFITPHIIESPRVELEPKLFKIEISNNN